MDTNKINSIKIILLGESYTGKTNILKRIEKNIFEEKIESTNNISYFGKLFYYYNKNLILDFYDTDGQENYRILLFI